MISSLLGPPGSPLGPETTAIRSVVAVTPELVSEDLLLHGDYLWAGHTPSSLPSSRSSDR